MISMSKENHKALWVCIGRREQIREGQRRLSWKHSVIELSSNGREAKREKKKKEQNEE